MTAVFPATTVQTQIPVIGQAWRNSLRRNRDAAPRQARGGIMRVGLEILREKHRRDRVPAQAATEAADAAEMLAT